jgi:hypothetical protein
MVSGGCQAYGVVMHAARLALLLCTCVAACSSSSPEPQPVEPPQLVVSGSCTHDEDTLLLAVAIANRGRGPAAPSATRIEFNSDPASGLVHRTRFIAPHAVDTFEVELPAVCSKIACGWNITIDAASEVHESGAC